MTKKELLSALDLVDKKEQEIRAKSIDESLSYKDMSYMEDRAMKAHATVEWVKQMIEENFGDIIEL